MEGEDDVFAAPKLADEKHLVQTPKGHGSDKSTRRILCVFFLICGCIVLAILLAAAVVVAIEVVKLTKEPTTPPATQPPPPAQCVPENGSWPTIPPPSSNTSSPDLQWWQSTVIYQCYPRSYQDSDGDGSGDLNGIISRVSYLADIGVKTLWLNPIFSSPQKDNGYDVSNYTDVDPLFGTLEQLQTLLSELHSRGMHLLLDFVPNHTSDQHPWFVESRQNTSNPKRNWYVWADGRDNGTMPPNNWLSFFNDSAWTYDNLTNQYYLHQFSSFQPDLNYTNPEVQEAIKDVLRFWLNRGVDGFRVDAVAYLLEDPTLSDEPVDPNHRAGCNITCYDYLIHNHTRNQPGIHDIIRGWRQVLDSYSASGQRFMVGEVYEQIDTVMSYYGEHGDEFHFPFNFFLLGNSNWTGYNVDQIVKTWLQHMPSTGWPNWVFGNHDNHRIASKAGPHLARALNVLLLTLPGTPTSYYGEEILMTDVDVPPDQRQDLYGDRDKERTPMQWSKGSNAGFTTGTPWLPLAHNYSTVNVQVENSDNTSILSLYKQLVAMRSSYAAFLNSNYSTVTVSNDVLAYIRSTSADPSPQFLVVINFAARAVVVDVNEKLQYPSCAQLYLSSSLNRTGLMDLSSLSLQPGEALIFVLN